jgi:transposase
MDKRKRVALLALLSLLDDEGNRKEENLTNVLKEKYGIDVLETSIDAVSLEDVVLEFKRNEFIDDFKLEKSSKQKQKKRWYVPRTIGRPCGKKGKR